MRKFTADFETTTDVDDCRVWAYALSEIGNPDNFICGNCIDDFIEWCKDPAHNYQLYFHNLKFDGSFIINWLLKNGFKWIKDKKDRDDNTFTTLITDTGVYYSITIYFTAHSKYNNKITIMDSLKILNFSVDKIAKDFNLPIRKLSLDYDAFREKGHQLTEEEIAYIRNDVEIMSRALNIMFSQDLTKMTIGSDALNDYKSTVSNFNHYFPVLDFQIDQDIRKGYKGGFTYLNPKYVGKETTEGYVLDKNSMYPSKMKSCRLPIGEPIYFDDKYEKDPLYDLYIQRLSCTFKLKSNKIPSIQVKNNPSFRVNEYIESTNGDVVTLTLCSPDLELFFENYDVENLVYQGGWKFKSAKGLFNNYIDKWTAAKIKAKKDGNGALYAIAKLMLNSLYGKFGLNPISRTKQPVLDATGVLKFKLNPLETRKPIYIPVAEFITAYARKDIIESSQKIRDYSLKKYGFDAYIYSDTDSIHCLLSKSDIIESGLDIDDYKLGAWKIESRFTKAKFLRQKCYIEQEDELKVTVAGLPKYLSYLIDFDNFNTGFTTEGLNIDKRKLRYKQTTGGVVLIDTDFTIK